MGEQTAAAQTCLYSVVITTYARPDLVCRAIASVLAQTLTDFELLVVDDASPDDTAARVAAFTDTRLRYLRQPTNQGVSMARNRGIAEARGRYIAFLDDDDRMPHTFLADVAEALTSAPPSVGFVVVAWELVKITPHGDVGMWRNDHGYTHQTVLPGERYFSELNGGGSGLVLTRACIEKTGRFDPEFVVGQDTEFLIRAAQHCDYMVLPQVALVMGHHEGPQHTKPSIRRARLAERLLEKHGHLLPAAMRIAKLRSAARLYYQFGDKQSGRRALFTIMRRYPLRLATYPWWLAYESADYLPKALRARLFRTYRHG
jgi:O-antigen biosynthesis protein